ncbi:MAG: hypothetical protein MSG64_07400 [Pyrinomonadaceae bacterium MAG19_C2-C3]|nr:hypothetical protein [Pyrinomonadaceae bacterium MAG19_C2-C3]
MANEPSTHGWKTYLAGASAILTGVIALTNGDAEVGALGIINGFALFGLRGALAKVISLISNR